ncbi:hypothetical protein TNCV_1121901 [Trichonephila clavipes]|nr:hypothetical protein TNCV_1121901 [Trichonephila clavipes]
MPQNLLEHVSASYLLLRLVGYQSSWRSTEDFQYKRPHLLGRSLCFSFRSYGLATDWIGDMATGICNDVLGIGLVGLGVKRREEFGRRISSSVPTSSKFRRRFRELSKTAFSLGSSALHVQDVRSGNKRSVVSRSPHTSVFFLVQVGISEQGALYFLVTAYVGRGLVSVDFADTGAKTLSTSS